MTRPRHLIPSGLSMEFLLFMGFVVYFLTALNCRSVRRELTIFYTNDVHAQYAPSKATWLKNKPLVGGYSALYVELVKQRGSAPNSILLDSGDLLTGGPVGDMVWRGTGGGFLLRFMNLLHYDVMTAGNHDFDLSVDNLLAMNEIADFPILGANLFDNDGSPLLGKGWALITRGGLRIGVIGLVTDHLHGLSSREVSSRVFLREAVDIGDSLASLLDPKTDLLVVLSHCGLWADRIMADAFSPVVDVIIGGHSHNRVDPPEVRKGVVIAQAGSKLRYLGRLDIEVENDHITDHAGKLILLEAGRDDEDPARGPITILADSLDEVVEIAFGDTIGYLRSDWKRSYHAESNVGNWVGDIIGDYTNSEVAFINSGGLRKDISAGPVTRRDIVELLPFHNSVVSFYCDGAELYEILVHNAAAAFSESHGILQVSGVKCRFTRGPSGEVRVEEVLIRGDELDPSRFYRCGTVDFVATGSPQKYLGMLPDEVTDYMVPLSRLAERELRRSGQVDSRIEGRLLLELAKK